MIDEKLLKKFPKKQVDEAIKLLTYHNAPELPKEESDTLPTMYIFRHGQSEDNAEFIFSGWRDPGLTQKGIEQAEVLAEKIKDKKLIEKARELIQKYSKHKISEFLTIQNSDDAQKSSDF